MTKAFRHWVSKEAQRRGWSIHDLAKRADVSLAMLTEVLSGQQQPNAEVCVGVAHAFNTPVIRMLHLAGLSSIEEEDAALIEAILEGTERLTSEQKRQTLLFIQYLLSSK
jgi:transcriptional regulator with XRE-family HTH domain